MKTIGDMITRSYPIYHKTISESFFSIRDTILFKKKSHFSNIFKKTAEKMCNSLTKQIFLLKLPRNFIEIFVFTIIILTMAYLVEIKNFNFKSWDH